MRKILLLAALAAASASAQTTGIGAAIPAGIGQFFDNNGRPLAGGKVCTYQAGTSTPLATYQDAPLTTPNANPVVLNSAGRPNSSGTIVGIWLNYQSYKIVLRTAGSDGTCSTGTIIWTMDNFTSPIPAINGGIVNVLSYGALCDGSTDDASAFNSAIASGFNVLVPGNRTCVIGSTLTMNNANQALLGQPGVILKRKAAVTSTLLTITANGNLVQGITFNGNSTGTNGGFIVRPNGVTGFQFLNNVIQNTVAGEYPFRCDSCVDTLIQGNQLITGMVGAGLTVFATSSNVQVTGNTVIHTPTNAGSSAYDFQGGAGGTAVIKNIVATGNAASETIGFCYEAGLFGGSSASQFTISGNSCTLSNSTGTASCASGSNQRVCGGISVVGSTDSVIANNTIAGASQNVDIAGIEVGNARITVSNNSITMGGASSGGAAGIQGYCADCRITGNIVNGWAQTAATNTAGIIMYANGNQTNADDTLISNNVIIFNGNPSSSQSGILLPCNSVSGSQNRNIITGNNIVGPGTGNSNYGINLFAADAMGCTNDGAIVANNSIYNIKTGLQLPNDTNLTIAANRQTTVTTAVACSSCSYAPQNLYGVLTEPSGAFTLNVVDNSNAVIQGGGATNYLTCNALYCLVSAPTTAASLPSCVAGLKGAIATVTDSNSVTWGATYTGSSSSVAGIYCDGTNWTVYAK